MEPTPSLVSHPLPMCKTDIRSSATFQVDFLALHWICVARLRIEHDMASGSYESNNWFSLDIRRFHDNIQRDWRPGRLELVSIISCNSWYIDRLRCFWTHRGRNEKCFDHSRSWNLLEHGCQWSGWILCRDTLPLLLGKALKWGLIPHARVEFAHAIC